MNQFSFGSGAAGGGFTLGTPKTAATTATTGFSFSTAAASGGFSFGSAAQAPAGSQPAGLFSFSRPGAAAQPASFSFGTPATATATPAANVFPLGANAPKLNFGGSTATQATGITGGFGFGSSVPTSVPSSQAAAPSGFVFGSAGTAATTAATTAQSGTTGGFTFSSGTTTQAGTASFNIGTAAPQAAPTGLTFGTAPAAAATTAATLGAAAQPTTPFSLGGQSSGLNFGSLPSTAATSAPTATLTASTSQGPALSFGTKLGVPSTAATTASTTTTSILGSTGPTLFASIASSSAPTSSTTTGLSLGAPSTGTASLGTLGFGLKAPGTTAAATSTATSTTSASGFALNLKPLTTTGAIGAVTATAAITSTTATSAPPVMTYAQLESLINKWSLELEDQEKHFLHQATQVNAWDRMLIENGEKITSLHREVEKVKLDQKRLDQELDFILSQQKELEDLLTPLEESVKEQSGTIYLQHADEERERTYKLAENIDAQLKHMAQDLKDITEHLNTSRGPADTSDPLQQICKILNAHMDSLQWIDQNSAVLQRKVEEVTKVCESRRKEQERSFRITFD
ncbi:nuclear pore glycoprotein p62-like isoform X2 [Harpia harpyja]|uniref:nuclear pore glycoprotein p62-like isoform X2 n=1 Tax=Harpia harpyja TaxID=202280 RepID=UPI0022B177F2|nr:nuclear pore glycoprotein p62-like isoform X2 [Harpia harpyja]